MFETFYKKCKFIFLYLKAEWKIFDYYHCSKEIIKLNYNRRHIIIMIIIFSFIINIKD